MVHMSTGAYIHDGLTRDASFDRVGRSWRGSFSLGSQSFGHAGRKDFAVLDISASTPRSYPADNKAKLNRYRVELIDFFGDSIPSDEFSLLLAFVSPFPEPHSFS
jgi:hypothetical protein